jgi:TRAP-type transport system periplasmic protein
MKTAFKFRRHLLSALGLAMAIGLGAGAQAQNRAFSFAYDQPPTTAYGVAGNMFDAKLKELSGGKFSINQFPGAQLGQEPVLLQKMRSGDIDFVITSTANASTVAPQAGVFSLHYLFRDQNHLMKTLADPGVSQAFRDMVKESVQGAHVLGLMTMGLRNMYSKKEVTKVEDLKGVKVRVQATKTEDTHFPAYGSQVVHMPFGDVYTSIQTGVIAMAENGVNVYLANKHYEVAPVLSMTEHEANNNCIWISEKTWNSLTPEQQKWVQAAAEEVSRREPAMALQLEKDSGERLKKLGVKVVEGVDKSGFIKAAIPIQDQLAAELGPHAVKILKLVRDIK